MKPYPEHEMKIEARKGRHRAACSDCVWRSVWWQSRDVAETEGRKHVDGEYPVAIATPLIER